MPKRRRGHERVSQLLAAAAAVFGDKGYKAATMTEIAARAGAPIGSLYQFFPNKEVLADALVARYGERLGEAIDALAVTAPQLSARALSDRLLDILVDLSAERRVALNLLETRWDQPEQRPGQFRPVLRAKLVLLFAAYAPDWSAERCAVAAVVLHHAMKALVQLAGEPDFAEKAAAIASWRALFAQYLARGDRLE